jgi:DNA primase
MRVKPRLTAELVFTHEAHNFQAAPGKLRGGCPRHESKSGTSFYVSTETLAWRCPACGAGGGPLQYWHWLRGGQGSPRGRDFVEGVRYFAEKVGLPLPERKVSPEEHEQARRREARRAVLETLIAHGQDVLWSERGASARAYLVSRGYTEDAIREQELGLYLSAAEIRAAITRAGHSLEDAQTAGVLSPKLEGYILCPWRDEYGQALTIYGTWKDRTPPEGTPKKRALPNPKAAGTEWEPTKRSPYLFDRARRAGHKVLTLVEGVTDAGVAHTHGETSVIACVAAELSHEQARTLARCGVKGVVICLDPDQAGESGIQSCMRSLLAVGVTPYVAPRLPDGLDPDECIIRHGIAAWRAHVERSVHAFRYQAELILKAHKPDGGWNDQARDAAAHGAVKWAAQFPAEREEELTRHFVRVIALEIEADPVQLLARVRLARGRAQETLPDGHEAGRSESPVGMGQAGQVSTEGWKQPLPLNQIPAPLPFPNEVLPTPLRAVVVEIARALNCPADFVGGPLLALAGGAIGNARHISITRSHAQPPCLFLVVIAFPGTAKSPALRILRRVFDEIQRQWLDEWRKEMDGWKQKKKAHDKGKGQDPGPRPVLRRCVVADATMESLAMILEENPRGLVMLRDELMELVASMNQYKGGKGYDRQIILKLWDGEPICIDRKSDRSRDGAPLYVARPFAAIVGGLQPAVVERFRGETHKNSPPPDDGFFDRFLSIYPVELDAVGERWREVSAESLAAWDRAVKRLLQLEMVKEDGGSGFRPYFYNLTEGAREAWKRFTDAHAAELNDPDFPSHLRGPWSKLRGYCGRLALILHCLRWACSEVEPVYAVDAVDASDMENAAQLVAYFKSHVRKVYAALDADPRIAEARKVLRCLERNPDMTVFTRRDLYQHLRRQFKQPEALDAPLRLLAEYGYLQGATPERGGRPGPVPERYMVNPIWIEQTRTQCAQRTQDPDAEGESVDPVYGVYGSEEAGAGHGDAWEGS